MGVLTGGIAEVDAMRVELRGWDLAVARFSRCAVALYSLAITSRDRRFPVIRAPHFEPSFWVR